MFLSREQKYERELSRLTHLILLYGQDKQNRIREFEIKNSPSLVAEFCGNRSVLRPAKIVMQNGALYLIGEKESNCFHSAMLGLEELKKIRVCIEGQTVNKPF